MGWGTSFGSDLLQALTLCLSCCYVTPRVTPFAQTHPVLPYVSLDMTQRPDYLEEDPAFITLSPPAVLARLLPDATLLHMEACEVDDTAAQIILRVQSTQIS